MTSSAPSLPRSILVGVAGIFGIVLIIVGAIGLRAPLDDYAPTGSAAPARARAAPARAEPPGGGVALSPGATAGSSPVTPSVPADVREARIRFSKDVQTQRFREAIKSLAQLLELDPEAPADSDVRDDIVELAMRVMLLDGPEPDSVFDLLSSHMGTAGADILYELITTRGGSRAARRADEMLKDEDVRERGSAALRVAYELRTARSCEDKIALLDRAKADGDGRTLGQLQLLNKSCSRRSGDCCLHNDPRLKDAVDGIKARLSGPE
jgi:hypothetical protein